MVEMEERELLRRSLKGYLEELGESGVDELYFAPLPVLEEGCRLEGNPRARLLLLTTGAGYAGEAGALLEKIIVAMGFAKAEVCLLIMDPCEASAGSLRGAIAARIAAVAPKVAVTLGEPATQLLLASDQPLERLRGRFHDLSGIPLMPSFHPDAMLENPALKREVWSDMQQVMRRLAPPN